MRLSPELHLSFVGCRLEVRPHPHIWAVGLGLKHKGCEQLAHGLGCLLILVPDASQNMMGKPLEEQRPRLLGCWSRTKLPHVGAIHGGLKFLRTRRAAGLSGQIQHTRCVMQEESEISSGY